MIKILPERVINQIAAGEVVERPSSVVKELIDNALDAGADKILIAISEGGQSLISVADNGSGMSKDDALLSFERHATSKITALSDLETISTNGFRGEALPSIASVSKVTLRSSRSSADDGSGVCIEIAGGRILSVKGAACTKGTTIEIRGLFYNVPARRKFLKGPRSDEIKIRELVCAYAMAYPHVDFLLSVDGDRVISLAPQPDLLSRASKVIRGAAVEISYQFDEVTVNGLIAHPSQAVSDGASLTIIVNKRFVSDKFILRAVKEGFSSTLKDKEFPVGVISVNLPGSMVDVNVHPQKSEVRFAQSQKVFAAVRIAVEEGIKNFRTPMMIETSAKMPNHNLPFSVQDSQKAPHVISMPAGTVQVSQTETPISSVSNRYRGLKYLGQLFACYLLFEGNGTFFVVDMHAAHERLNYNRIRNAVLTRTEVKSQQLLFSQRIPLSLNQIEELSTVGIHLQNYGYEWNESNDGIELISVPSILISVNHDQLIREVTGKESHGELPFALEETVAYICARLACHASIRSGHVLGPIEAYALLDQMESAEFAAACPHGRPCVIELSEKQIESWFGRDR